MLFIASIVIIYDLYSEPIPSKGKKTKVVSTKAQKKAAVQKKGKKGGAKKGKGAPPATDAEPGDDDAVAEDQEVLIPTSPSKKDVISPRTSQVCNSSTNGKH